MKYNKLLGGVLTGATLFQVTAPVMTIAKEATNPDTEDLNQKEDNTVTKVSETKGAYPILVKPELPPVESLTDSEEEFESLGAYVSSVHTIYFKDVGNRLFKDSKLNPIPVGTYVKVVDREVKDNVPYVLVESLGLELGWAKEDAIKYVPDSKITETKLVDTTKIYGQLKDNVTGYTQPKHMQDFEKSAYSLKKDSKVEILEEVKAVQETDYDTWYEYKTPEFTGWVNQKDVKDLSLMGEGIVGGKSKVDTLNVYSEPTYTSEIETTVTETLDKTLDLFDVATEELKNIESEWLKVVPLDDKDAVVKDAKPSYILKSDVTIKEYAQISNEEYLDTTEFYKVKEDSKVWNKPQELKGDIVSDVTLPKDSVVFANKRVTVKVDGKDSVWYSVVKEGKILGFIPSEHLELVEKDSDVYYTVEGDTTVDQLLEDFKLSMKDFYYMNASLPNGELKAGTQVKLQEELHTYDSSKVKVNSNATTQLINDMIPSISYIKSKGLYPSVAFAQAIHESGGGTSDLAKESNNLFGVKGTYNGQGKSWKTKENVAGGAEISINATFKHYPSKADSILDYVDLISTRSRYSNAVNALSPFESIKAIKDGGYATDPQYIYKIMNTIDTYDLTQFDY